MRWLERLVMQVRMLSRGREAARLDEELNDHLARQMAENIAAGMSGEEARYATLRAFGNPGLLREQARATWNWAWLESILRDVRYGARRASIPCRRSERNKGGTGPCVGLRS